MENIITVPSLDRRSLITEKTTGSVQFDPETFEPYMQLEAPHQHIRLTPPRATDVPVQVEIMVCFSFRTKIVILGEAAGELSSDVCNVE